jgi:hypothetical protein
LFSSRCGEVLTAAVQKCPLGRIRSEGERLFIGQRCFRAAAKAPEQIGPDRMEQVVSSQVEAVNDGKGSVGSLDLRNRFPLPMIKRSFPGCSLRPATASPASPLRRMELLQGSGSARVMDATYFTASLRAAVKGLSVCLGQKEKKSS